MDPFMEYLSEVTAENFEVKIPFHCFSARAGHYELVNALTGPKQSHRSYLDKSGISQPAGFRVWDLRGYSLFDRLESYLNIFKGKMMPESWFGEKLDIYT